MKIEVGKWKTRNGRLAIVTGKHAPAGRWVGQVADYYGHQWFDDGRVLPSGTPHPLDLISPWEDSQTQIKSESKMDVNIGDKVTVEGIVAGKIEDDLFVDFGGENNERIPRSAIKSVEPAPPGVGDRCEWSDGPPRLLIAHGDDWCLWRSQSGGLEPYSLPLSKMQEVKGFRVVKRAGGE